VVALLGTLVAPAGTAAYAAPSPTPATPPGNAAQGLTWGAAPANNKLGANRAHYTYTLPAGTSITDALAVANYGKTPITLKVYASDAFTTSTGAIDLLAAGQKPVDAGSWITVKTPTITLRPQESASIPFTLTIPDNAAPGDHTAGIVTSLATGGSSGVSLDRRLGSRIYLRVPGTLHPLLTITATHISYRGTLNPIEPGSAVITYTVTNTGNVRLHAHQSVRVSGPLSILGHTETLTDLPEILPGSSLTRTVTVSDVWPATHLTATVRLRPVASTGDTPTRFAAITGAGTIWAWPWTQLIVLAAAVLGYLLLRRRRAHTVAAAITAARAEACHTPEDSQTDAHRANRRRQHPPVRR
jgi:hypothetical protein